jgi:hypothetical protein
MAGSSVFGSSGTDGNSVTGMLGMLRAGIDGNSVIGMLGYSVFGIEG